MHLLPNADYLRECLDYEPLTGILTWRIRPREHFKTDRSYRAFNTQFSGTNAGVRQLIGYRAVKINGCVFLVHRVIWKWMTGADPALKLDHYNGVRDDNRWTNLREATTQENARNKVGHTSVGLKGVSCDTRKLLPKPFRARIIVNRKKIGLGSFATAQEAHAAYLAAAERYFSQFANGRMR